jgi:hypothetical protein
MRKNKGMNFFNGALLSELKIILKKGVVRDE